MSSSLLCISITLLIVVVTVQSVHHAYLYDNGKGDQEHCCLVKVRKNFCLATPITRSLVQVNKQCHRLGGPKRRQSNGRKDQEKDEKIITRRLDVQMSDEVGQNILLELKKPLQKNILDNDLVCLTSTNKKIHLDKCYVELPDELNADDYIPPRQKDRRRGRQQKRAVEEETKTADDKAENENRRVELGQPVRVSEGYGLSLHRTYTIKAKNIRPISRQERKCSSWYRSQIRRLRYNQADYKKLCIPLNDHREECINQLARNAFDTNSTSHQQPSSAPSFPMGSKLYCKNELGSNKFLGNYHRGQLCFYLNDQVTMELKFTDTVGISDLDKNSGVLQFIANNEKLVVEFGDDCHNQTRLVEVNEGKIIE